MRWRRRARLAWEVLRALPPMVRIELGLRRSDLRETCRRLGVRCDLTSTEPPSDELPVLPRWSRAPIRASYLVVSRWPAGDTCLRQCLLIGHRLRDLEPVLRIGVRRADGRFAAHSWLEIDGKALDPTAARYAVLGSAG
ncbi:MULTISPECIES: lasso peptide biosynthesis B2 protein [Amycolatopsis]|uniref:lasso peptide biosynthesis B2 protein n=1 Tax=Amycolatopsis TaxID=1813 RepID=UPI001E49F863|nr:MULTISPECIES: lasso peptide biosynthesis B2 protein [Amycolatopsis]